MRTPEPGMIIPALGRKAATYVVVTVDAKGFTMVRGDTGSKVRVSAKKIARLASRLASGETVLWKGNASAGGVDGTSAIRDALLWACDAERRGDVVVRKGA